MMENVHLWGAGEGGGTMYFTSYHISRQSKTDSLWFTLRFCFPASQISRLDESFQKIIRHFVPNIWECEKVRLCDLSLRVIFVWPGQLIWFCFSVSQISRLSKSFQKNICHCVSNIWECEKVRVCDLNMRVIFVWAGQLLQFCLPASQISRLDKSFQKNIRHGVPNIWECEKVRLCKLNLRVIFDWAGKLLQFFLPVSQISHLDKSF